MVYDERILSFPRIDRASLLTLDGRVEVPFRFGTYAEGDAATHTRTSGSALPQCYLLPGDYGRHARTHANGAADFLGVDLGIITVGDDQ